MMANVAQKKYESQTSTSLTRRAAWLVWSGGVNVANSVLLWMVLARWRDTAEVGRFTIMMSVFLTFTALCTLGLGPYLVSEIARRKEHSPALLRSFIASAAAFLVSTSGVFAGLMIMTGFVVSDASDVRLTLVLMSPALPLSGLLAGAEAVFIATGQTRVIALANTVENIFRTLLPLALVLTGYGLPVIGLSIAVARVMACLVYAVAVRHELSALRLARWEEMRALAVKAPTFAGITVLSALHWQLAALLLGRLGSEVAAAHYGVASRFLVPVAVLLASYTSVIQPEATSRAAASMTALGEFLSRTLRLVFVLALPFVVGAALLAREALSWLFGDQYGDAALALGLLAASALPLSLVMIVARGLVATNHQHVDLIGNATGVVTCLLFSLALIPSYGATGAAAAHLLSMIALAVVEMGYAARYLFRVEIGKALMVCVAPLFVMSVVVWQARVWGLWSAMLLGAMVYFAALWLLQRYPKPELKTSAGQVVVSKHITKPPRILMVGPHQTCTLGGISTVIDGLLRSAVGAEVELRHIASQNDEYRGLGKFVLAVKALVQFVLTIFWWRPNLALIHVGSNASLYRKAVFITLARWLGQRVVTHFHAGDFEHYYARQSKLGRRLIRAGLRRSHKLIAVSQAAEQRLRELLPEADIVTIPNGIRTKEFAPVAREQDAPVRLLFVGAMGKLKGERDLLRALQLVAERVPQLRVSLLGHGAESVETLCHEGGLRSRIEHLGPVPHHERARFFRQADIFVLPSYGEGMPLAVLEAMAAGLPVIATNVGGIPELITHCAEGFLIAPGDIRDLAARIVLLGNNQKLRMQMGQQAMRKAQQFDEQIVMKHLMKELRTMLHPRKPTQR